MSAQVHGRPETTTPPQPSLPDAVPLSLAHQNYATIASAFSGPYFYRNEMYGGLPRISDSFCDVRYYASCHGSFTPHVRRPTCPLCDHMYCCDTCVQLLPCGTGGVLTCHFCRLFAPFRNCFLCRNEQRKTYPSGGNVDDCTIREMMEMLGQLPGSPEYQILTCAAEESTLSKYCP